MLWSDEDRKPFKVGELVWVTDQGDDEFEVLKLEWSHLLGRWEVKLLNKTKKARDAWACDLFVHKMPNPFA